MLDNRYRSPDDIDRLLARLPYSDRPAPRAVVTRTIASLRHPVRAHRLWSLKPASIAAALVVAWLSVMVWFVGPTASNSNTLPVSTNSPSARNASTTSRALLTTASVGTNLATYTTVRANFVPVPAPTPGLP